MFPRKCRPLLFLSLALFAAAGSLSAQSYMIGTYAGADPFLDGNLATSARLYHPEAVLVDRSNTI